MVFGLGSAFADLTPLLCPSALEATSSVPRPRPQATRDLTAEGPPFRYVGISTMRFECPFTYDHRTLKTSSPGRSAVFRGALSGNVLRPLLFPVYTTP